MYVWFRLARMALSAKARGPYRMGGESRLDFHCLPSDIDTNLHLNNARYMMLADVGRIDIFLRAGLIRLARERGWAPMLGGLQTVFVREIRLWQRFQVVSTVETWQGSQVIGGHRFVLEDGRTAAHVLTTAGIYDRRQRRFVEMDEALAALGHSIVPRQPTEAEQAFMASHARLRDLARSGGARNGDAGNG